MQISLDRKFSPIRAAVDTMVNLPTLDTIIFIEQTLSWTQKFKRNLLILLDQLNVKTQQEAKLKLTTRSWLRFKEKQFEYKPR